MSTPSDPSSADPSFSMSAYFVPSRASDEIDSGDELASLPSETTTETDLETLSDESSDAEAEWLENIQQLEMLLGLVIAPFLGKMLGRRFAYWGWARFVEWKYPGEVVMRNPAAFKAAGAAKAAATI